MVAQLKRDLQFRSSYSLFFEQATIPETATYQSKPNRMFFVQLVGRDSEGGSIAWNHWLKVRVTNYSQLLIDSAGNLSSREAFRCELSGFNTMQISPVFALDFMESFYLNNLEGVN